MYVKHTLSISALALLAGCAVNPKPLTPTQIDTTARENIVAVDADQEPVTAPINLYEAMAPGAQI